MEKQETQILSLLNEIKQSNIQIQETNREIKDSNTHIKNELKLIRDELKLKSEILETVETRLVQLETENHQLKEQIRASERKVRQKNIVIFGVPEDENVEKYLKQLMNEKLEVNVNAEEIDNIYRIGKKDDNKPRPVLLEFVRYRKKQEIFKNIKNLKGTGISISNDLTSEERRERNFLYKHLIQARKKQYQAKIIGNRLLVGGEVYSCKDLLKSGVHIKSSGKIESESEQSASNQEVDTIREGIQSMEKTTTNQSGSKDIKKTQSNYMFRSAKRCASDKPTHSPPVKKR